MRFLGSTLGGLIWEPCAGQCHIVDVLREAGHSVLATDITPHESLDGVHNFLDMVPNPINWTPTGSRFVDQPHWIITNPPYSTELCTATDIIRHALTEFPLSHVAMLVRLAWLEPCDERADILLNDPPTDVLVLPRVNYIGAPSSNNQTSVWVIWFRGANHGVALTHWFPSDIRKPTYDWSTQ